ncbi:DUF397 domain-containing protein [Thermopolyspora sp. NPDC052614]|uniref:DUF397 domain-containing protein n=1 Tax=Thermopolyspora sp. NPDC052614 TaxID=3155682 RepID=UPI0034312933
MDLSNVKWIKSSHSGVSGGDCVEVAALRPGVVVVRDSKNPSGATLSFTSEDWNAFLLRLKHGVTVRGRHHRPPARRSGPGGVGS